MHKSILLIYPEPDFDKDHRFGYSLQLLYLSSSLKKLNFQVKFIDYSVEKFDEGKFNAILNDVVCVIIELDSFPLKRSANISNGIKIASLIKKSARNIFTIAIGKHCTLVNSPMRGFDLTVCGEPEIDLPKIVHDYFTDVQVKSGLINLNTIADLSTLPFPDRSVLTSDQIRGKRLHNKPNLAPSALLETSRGCPGKCSFCQRKGWSEKLRYFSETQVFSDFKSLISSGIKNIWLADENFTANIDRAKTILNMFAELKGSQQLKIAISSWTKIDKELVSIAKKAGVSVISFGVESTSPEILNFYNKSIDFGALNEALEEANKLGIFTIGNFIIGAPKDNSDTIQGLLNYVLKSGFDDINVKLLDYMIGSDIFAKLPDEIKGENIHLFACAENGLSKYTKAELLRFKEEIITKFKVSRKIRLLKKINKFGPPYYTEVPAK